jgi:hypothetical protein
VSVRPDDGLLSAQYRRRRMTRVQSPLQSAVWADYPKQDMATQTPRPFRTTAAQPRPARHHGDGALIDGLGRTLPAVAEEDVSAVQLIAGRDGHRTPYGNLRVCRCSGRFPLHKFVSASRATRCTEFRRNRLIRVSGLPLRPPWAGIRH